MFFYLFIIREVSVYGKKTIIQIEFVRFLHTDKSENKDKLLRFFQCEYFILYI